MKRLIDYAKILRSKNAGPLNLTFDIIFNDKESMEYILKKKIITPDLISKLYCVNKCDVEIISYEIVNSMKITIPRKYISGSIYDMDIYGCQQHNPLANVEVI